MKYVFLIGFLAVLFLKSVFVVSAQAPTLAPTPCVIAPTQCGELNSKCCFYTPVNACASTWTASAGVLKPILDGLMGQVINPIIAPLDTMMQTASQPCLNGTPTTPGDLTNPACFCTAQPPPPLTSLSKFCSNINSKEKGACESCYNGSGVWTGAGCIYADTKSFIEKTLLGWGIGIAGTIALLCIIYAAFSIQTSQGNAEKIKKAQELLTSCITGLLLIIFSVFILRVIGVNILQIPGLN